VFSIEDLPHELSDSRNASFLTGILRGAERESLRVTTDGKISLSPHPETLGSALTHPQITTDFSEALLEFITPPCHTITDLLAQLDILQRYTASKLPADEQLWYHSMPCALGADRDIPVARYGNSNNGQMKTIYRIGLGHRYGRAMQTVAGLHYNFSMPNAFWAFLSRRDNSFLDIQEYKNQRYFGLIRNFRRHYWLLIYLFGASPALCKSFIGERHHNLLPLDDLQHTLHLPYATSLRMGDLGYQSGAQESLYVCYNTKKSYIESLCAAITQPHAAYEAIGVKSKEGYHQQLNTGLLQIENEFYSSIRPKRTTHHGETALAGLDNRGVEYIEVRCLDVDPFNPLGIGAEQIRFLDTFLIYCALKDSPPTDCNEATTILRNQKTAVTQGRKPGVSLEHPQKGEISLSAWGTELLNAMEPVAELMDGAHKNRAFSDSLKRQRKKLENPGLTPSAQLLDIMKEKKLDYAAFALQQSKDHQQQMLAQPLSENVQQRMESMALESEAEQVALESNSQLDFDEFLTRYYRQYRRCCGSFME